MADDNLRKRFVYVPPTGNQPERYVKLRAKAAELAYMVDDLCPESREKSLAITKIEEAIMWANASIARNENAIQPVEAVPEGLCPVCNTVKPLHSSGKCYWCLGKE